MKYILPIVILFVCCNNKIDHSASSFNHLPMIHKNAAVVALPEQPLHKEKKFPYVVYRKCEPAYAVRADKFGEGYYDERRDVTDYYCYFGKRCSTWPESPGWPLDSSESAEIGNEYQFKDSITAIRSYLSFRNRRDSIETVRVRKKFVADSIYKCNHSYE